MANSASASAVASIHHHHSAPHPHQQQHPHHHHPSQSAMVEHGPGVNVGHPMSHPHGHTQAMNPGVPTTMGGGGGHMTTSSGNNGGNGNAPPGGMPNSNNIQMNGPTVPGTPGPSSGAGQPGSASAPPHSQTPQTSQQQSASSQQQQQQPTTATQRLAAINEQTWIQLGAIADQMQDYDRAISCFESALRHNPYSVPALTKIGVLCKSRNQFQRAVEYFQRIINVDNNNGGIWGLLGHCYLLMDDLQKAYNAYQQALYLLPNANVGCFTPSYLISTYTMLIGY
jgi:hypothetical protein